MRPADAECSAWLKGLDQTDIDRSGGIALAAWREATKRALSAFRGQWAQMPGSGAVEALHTHHVKEDDVESMSRVLEAYRAFIQRVFNEKREQEEEVDRTRRDLAGVGRLLNRATHMAREEAARREVVIPKPEGDDG